MTEQEKKEIAIKNPLILAFIGDAVWSLYVREYLVKTDAKVGELHSRSTAKVSAVAQSSLFEKVSASFDETENDIARRARNTHNNTYPKNCTLAEYKRATALEAVIGYNYLTQNNERIKEFFERCL